MQYKGLRQDHRYTRPDARLNTNYFPEIIPYVDALVTIGTPFWGSRLATFLIEDGIQNSAARTLGKGFLEAMGQKQLQEMAVPVTSARFDSYYTIRKNTDYIAGEYSGYGFTDRTRFAPLLIVNAIHASPFPETVYDMAYVPQICVSRACDHSTLHYVFHHLYGKTITGFAPDVDPHNFNNYITTFRVNFPDGVIAKDQDLEIEFLGVSDSAPYEVSFGRGWEIDYFRYFDPRRENAYFMAVQGQIEPRSPLRRDDLDRALKARFRFSAPGYKTRTIETLIQPTYTTYIEVSLSRIDRSKQINVPIDQSSALALPSGYPQWREPGNLSELYCFVLEINPLRVFTRDSA